MADTGEQPVFRSGFVALVGRPSVGKSTLLNACLGEKVAITSPVAQTTRRRLRGVVNTPTSQLVIVDTPGLHKPKDALGKELNRVALSEVGDVDAVAFLIDAKVGVSAKRLIADWPFDGKALTPNLVNWLDTVNPFPKRFSKLRQISTIVSDNLSDTLSDIYIGIYIGICQYPQWFSVCANVFYFNFLA